MWGSRGAIIPILGVALFAGCAADPAPTPSVPPVTTPESAPPESAPSDSPPLFRMPHSCADLVSPTTASALADDGLDLLGGPGGRYGEDYFAEPTPEERRGGISCVWGDESWAASLVIVSVAPVTSATRAGIIGDLATQGLNQSQIDDATSYAQIGDDVSAPAVLNVVRSDSWISVIHALGGEERFQHAAELVDDVTGQVYSAG